jgi:hypothetical protein
MLGAVMILFVTTSPNRQPIAASRGGVQGRNLRQTPEIQKTGLEQWGRIYIFDICRIHSASKRVIEHAAAR